MQKTEMLQIRVSPDIKTAVALVLERMGLSTGEAVNIFLHQVVNTDSIPFAIQGPRPNAETVEAINEIEAKIKSGAKARFATADDALRDLGI